MAMPYAVAILHWARLSYPRADRKTIVHYHPLGQTEKTIMNYHVEFEHVQNGCMLVGDSW